HFIRFFLFGASVMCGGPGGLQCEPSGPGPHQSCVEFGPFHSSHIFREGSVRRFSREYPIATANRSAPSPQSMTCPVLRITSRATRQTFFIFLTPPTEPALRVGPCMQHESSSTTPSSFGSPPSPTV